MGNHRITNAELASQINLANASCCISTANVANLGFGELCLRMINTTLVHIQLTIVAAIIFGGSPAEIFKTAIAFDSIKVPALHSVGARANKGFEYKAVDAKCFELRSIGRGEVDTQIPLGIRTELHSLPSISEHSPPAAINPRVPNASVTSNSIAFISTDFPVFNCGHFGPPSPNYIQ